MSAPSTYRWHIVVRGWDHYGDRVASKTPMTVLAPTRAVVTEKVRAAFGAKYDDFRKFWSHDWTLTSVEEVAAASHTAAAAIGAIVEAIESHGRGEQDADDTLTFVADTVDEIRGRAHQIANGGGG